MAAKIEDELTVISSEDFFVSLWRVWLTLFGLAPSKDSVLVLLAQWAFETGWGKSMHCYNFGNAKSADGDGFDYTYFRCGEEVRVETANRWISQDPSRVHVIRQYEVEEKGQRVHKASVVVEPEHPACRFRAFQTIDEGLTDYLLMLKRRFAGGWPYVLKGDPAGFVHAIKLQGYFTADEEHYKRSIVSIFQDVKRSLRVDVDKLPVVSDEDAQRILNVVALTSASTAEEVLQQLRDEQKGEES